MMQLGILVAQQLRRNVADDPVGVGLEDLGVLHGHHVEAVRRTFQVDRVGRDQLDRPSREIVVGVEVPQREDIITISFAVVAFSVFVQGLTISPLLRKVAEIPN